MTINQLASAIAKREGKKSQARIGDIREILKIICTIEAEDMIKNPDGDTLAIDTLCRETAKIVDRLQKRRKKK